MFVALDEQHGFDDTNQPHLFVHHIVFEILCGRALDNFNGRIISSPYEMITFCNRRGRHPWRPASNHKPNQTVTDVTVGADSISARIQSLANFNGRIVSSPTNPKLVNRRTRACSFARTNPFCCSFFNHYQSLCVICYDTANKSMPPLCKGRC